MVKLDPDNRVVIADAFQMFKDGSFPVYTMRVALKNGEKHEVTLQFPKGHPKNPFDWEDVERTFRGGARAAGLSREKTDQFVALCKELECLEDLAPLAECLSADD